MSERIQVLRGMRTEAADSHMKRRELEKERGGEGESGCKEGQGGKRGWEVLVKRNFRDLETYEEPVTGVVQRKLALIAK